MKAGRMKSFTWCLSLCICVEAVLAARILAVLPLPAKSHHILFQAVLRTLAEHGHQVIAYTPYPLAHPVANYTNVDLDIKSIDNKLTQDVLHDMMTWPPHRAYSYTRNLVVEIMGNVFKNKKILELINSTEEFDLVILEAFYAQEAFLGFGHKFKAPVVNIHPFGALTEASFTAGNPLNLASAPDFPLPYSDKMSFLQRFYNTFTKLFSLYIYYTESLTYQQQTMSKAFKDPTIPPVEKLIRNVSLYINNAHPYVNYPQANTPNMVSLGGIHLATERKPLQPEIKKFLDEAVHGVIYFSLGSVVPDQLLGEQFLQYFINVFRDLPQRVLWKTNSEFKDLPVNILTAKWLPQQDILAHHNVVLFLTHGGLFSQHEAIYAGVPVVCLPFFVDQPMNAKFYEAKEVGVWLHFDNLSEETISSALLAVLNDPKYKKNMLKLSSIYRDQQQSPADTLVYWIDYVLRHGGAQHLTPASARLHWYQLWLLDIWGAILLTLVVTFIAVYIAMNRTFAFLRNSLGQKVNIVKKQK